MMAMKSGVFCFLVVIFVWTCEGVSAESENVVRFESMSGEQTEQTKQTEQTDAWCEMCELIMDRVKILIKEKDSEGKVNSTLYNLCELVSGEMRQQCYQMVPLLKYQLTHGFDSHSACLMLDFCAGGKAPAMIMAVMSKMNGNGFVDWKGFAPVFQRLAPQLMEFLHTVGLSRSHEGFSVTCMMCKAGVGVIDSSLQPYKKTITDYVIGICNDLPSPTNRACSDAMGFYIPAWWDAFFAKVASPGEICSDFGLCTEPGAKKSPNVELNK